MKVYILDSGGTSLDKLLAWLAEIDSIQEVAVIKNPNIFLERVELEHPEMVFIRLGNRDISGLRIGEMINTMDLDTKVIFISDEREYAVDAYEVGAYSYLLCPIEKRKFQKIFS